jgi:hypothetical protein
MSSVTFTISDNLHRASHLRTISQKSEEANRQIGLPFQKLDELRAMDGKWKPGKGTASAAF